MVKTPKPPPFAPRPAAGSPLPGGLGACKPHPPTRHAQALSPLGTGFQDRQARRFHLAAWLLGHHSRQGSQSAITALILALVDVLLATGLGLLYYLSSSSIDPDWWFLRLLLLALAALTLGCLILSAVFALFAAARLRPRGMGGAPAVDAAIFFQGGTGAGSRPDPFPAEEEFRQRFQGATRQQMLAGALAELYALTRFRFRQERWLRLALASGALALLLFGLIALGMFIGLLG